MMKQETVNKKSDILKQRLKEIGSIAIAFSGGVDSAFLLKTAQEVLGKQAIAVTAAADFFPKREMDDAADFCKSYGIKQIVCPINFGDKPEFYQNPKDRCYHCKKALFSEILDTAQKNGSLCVAEGSNTDDAGDYRPGMKAIQELGILSLLREAGLSKEEIRYLSRETGLPTWNKPSCACLASRIPYGEEITSEKLERIEKSEKLLAELGFGQARVRLYNDTARIELLPREFEKLLQEPVRLQIVQKLQEYGFTYVSMDLEGYRTGSLNEVLDPERQTKSNRNGSL